LLTNSPTELGTWVPKLDTCSCLITGFSGGGGDLKEYKDSLSFSFPMGDTIFSSPEGGEKKFSSTFEKVPLKTSDSFSDFGEKTVFNDKEFLGGDEEGD
jgi:hypothetical protein